MLDIADRLAIEALVTEHAWLIDHGEAHRLPELYTEDARVLGIGPDKNGRAAIAVWAQERAAMTDRRSRHVQTNVRLVFRSADEVEGTVVLSLYRHDGAGAGPAQALMVAEYEDRYRRGTDGWRFSERRLTVLFGG